MLRPMFVFGTLLMLCAASVSAAPGKVGKEFDMQGFFDQAIRAGSKRIVVPPGHYRVTPHNREHLVLRNLSDVQIIADNVEMICTQTTRALTLANCRNVSVRGMTIDYDPLPFTQGHITAISPDKSVLDVEIYDGYPAAEAVANFKLEIFAADTRTLRTHDYGIDDPMVIDPRHFRLKKQGARTTDPEQLGDIVAIGANYAPDGSIPHAVYLEKCVNVKLENVDLWASNCFGFLEDSCDGSIYQRCRIDRRPLATDIVKRAAARIRSLDADAFHSGGAAKGPAYIDCVAQFMGDDAINIHGSYDMVTACSGSRLRVLMKDQTLTEGEPVELLTYEGVRLPDAKVIKVERDGKIEETERTFLGKQQMDEGLRTRWTPDAYKVTLDRAVDLPEGSLICSTRRIGNGFLVKGCRFGYNRSRGILIKASDGKVIDNTLVGSWGEAIKVSPEYWWLESGSSNNVVIEGNVISACRTIPIAVYANGGTGRVAPAGAHRNITITHNRITDCPLPNIAVTSTDGLIIEGNTTAPATDQRDVAWMLGGLELNQAKLEPIMTTQCANVTEKNNTAKNKSEKSNRAR